MEPKALTCPNCGAGLGPMQDGQYLCAYCGHRSIPARPFLHPAQQDVLVAEALAKYQAARLSAAGRSKRIRGAVRELVDDRAADDRSAVTTMMSLGAFFLLIGTISWVVALWNALTAHQTVDAHQVAITFFVIASCLCLIAGVLFYVGVRILRALRRDAKLRTQGLRGRAVITSYREKPKKVVRRFELLLRVELVGRAPYMLEKRTEEVLSDRLIITTGTEVPVYVDAARPDNVLIDWDTASLAAPW